MNAKKNRPRWKLRECTKGPADHEWLERSNSDRTHRFVQTKRVPAAKSVTVAPPPIGYVVTDRGRWAQGPNPAVQETIEEVFRRFQLLGMPARVQRDFFREGLKLRRRAATRRVRGRPTRS